MHVRKGAIESAKEGATSVYYLKQRNECDPGLGDPDCAGIAAGVERWWMDRAQQLLAAHRYEDHEFAMRQVVRWSAFADAHWPTACDDLAAGLPEIEAFTVVPSRRTARSDPLVNAMRRHHPSALELVYVKAGHVEFGRADHEAIKSALHRKDQIVLTGHVRFAVVDDWMGGGNTFRAISERVRDDQPAAEVTILGAFPGLSDGAAALLV